MSEAERQSARIAIAASSLKRRLRLEDALERGGWYVVINAPLKTGMLSRVTESRPDALIVDIESASDQDMEVMKFLLKSSSVPVLISDAEVEYETGDELQWNTRLNEKLEAMISGSLLHDDRVGPSALADYDRSPAVDELPEFNSSILAPEALPAYEQNVVTLVTPAMSSSEEAVKIDQKSEHHVAVESPLFPAAGAMDIESQKQDGTKTGLQDNHRAIRVWVLGASLGGPRAVARFLNGIPADMEITFILVQRIDPAFIPILVKQLKNNCALSVMPAANGHVLHHGEVIVVPTDQRFMIEGDGVLSLSGLTTDAQSGGLDHAMREVAGRYESNAGAIIFSGMGDYGINGCHAILESGGTVWTQNADSCVIGSMPNHVRHACKIEISAEPEALANHLIEKLTTDDFVHVGNAAG